MIARYIHRGPKKRASFIFGITPCLLLAQGFRVRRIDWCYLRFDKIQDGSWRHLEYTKITITSQPVCRLTWCLDLEWGFRLSLDFYHGVLHTRTAVARNPCVSWDFLFVLPTFSEYEKLQLQAYHGISSWSEITRVVVIDTPYSWCVDYISLRIRAPR